MFKYIQQLNKANILTFFGWLRILIAYSLHGKNLFAILRFRAGVMPEKIACADEDSATDFKSFYKQCKQLAYHLKAVLDVSEGSQVAILCRNHSPYVKTLVALSGLGAKANLINLDNSAATLVELLQAGNYDLLVYDIEFWKIVRQSKLDCPTILSRHLTFESIESFSEKEGDARPVALKGQGTVSFINANEEVEVKAYDFFLVAFKTLLKELELATFPHAFIAVPLYHHSGVFALVNMLLLGKKVALCSSFETAEVNKTLIKQKIQIVFLHPFLLRKIVKKGSLELIYTKRLICVEAGLNQQLIADTQAFFGDKLCRLYTHQQLGYAVVANPAMLKNDSKVLGKAVAGYQLKIVDTAGAFIEDAMPGHLCIYHQSAWHQTKDIAFRNEEGHICLMGREAYRLSEGHPELFFEMIQYHLLDNPAILQAQLEWDDKAAQTIKATVAFKKGYSMEIQDLHDYLQEKDISTSSIQFQVSNNTAFDWQGRLLPSMILEEQWQL